MRFAHSTRSLPGGERSAAGADERKRARASKAPISEYQTPTLLQPPCSNRSTRVLTHFDDRPARSLAGFKVMGVAEVSSGEAVVRIGLRFRFFRIVFIVGGLSRIQWRFRQWIENTRRPGRDT